MSINDDAIEGLVDDANPDYVAEPVDPKDAVNKPDMIIDPSKDKVTSGDAVIDSAVDSIENFDVKIQSTDAKTPTVYGLDEIVTLVQSTESASQSLALEVNRQIMAIQPDGDVPLNPAAFTETPTRVGLETLRAAVSGILSKLSSERQELFRAFVEEEVPNCKVVFEHMRDKLLPELIDSLRLLQMEALDDLPVASKSRNTVYFLVDRETGLPTRDSVDIRSIGLAGNSAYNLYSDNPALKNIWDPTFSLLGRAGFSSIVKAAGGSEGWKLENIKSLIESSSSDGESATYMKVLELFAGGRLVVLCEKFLEDLNGFQEEVERIVHVFEVNTRDKPDDIAAETLRAIHRYIDELLARHICCLQILRLTVATKRLLKSFRPFL